MSTESKPVQKNFCPMDKVLKILMGPWTTYILWLLEQHDSLRFGEIKNLMQGISAKVLTQRLRMLEDEGLVSRHVNPTIPPEVSYALTAKGQELREVLQGIHKVALKWDKEENE